jgi:hypothetical protein
VGQTSVSENLSNVEKSNSSQFDVFNDDESPGVSDDDVPLKKARLESSKRHNVIKLFFPLPLSLRTKILGPIDF